MLNFASPTLVTAMVARSTLQQCWRSHRPSDASLAWKWRAVPRLGQRLGLAFALIQAVRHDPRHLQLLGRFGPRQASAVLKQSWCHEDLLDRQMQPHDHCASRHLCVRLARFVTPATGAWSEPEAQNCPE